MKRWLSFSLFSFPSPSLSAGKKIIWKPALNRICIQNIYCFNYCLHMKFPRASLSGYICSLPAEQLAEREGSWVLYSVYSIGVSTQYSSKNPGLGLISLLSRIQSRGLCCTMERSRHSLQTQSKVTGKHNTAQDPSPFYWGLLSLHLQCHPQPSTPALTWQWLGRRQSITL